MFQDDDDIVNNKTMVQYPQDSGTLVPSRDLVDGTVLTNDTGTLVANSEAGTMLELQSDLGTMVINSDTEEEATMKSKLVPWQHVPPPPPHSNF
jgi:serine/threonine kinase 3